MKWELAKEINPLAIAEMLEKGTLKPGNVLEGINIYINSLKEEISELKRIKVKYVMYLDIILEMFNENHNFLIQYMESQNRGILSTLYENEEYTNEGQKKEWKRILDGGNNKWK